MPQLDPVTFLSQFFWLCIVFSSLYLILVKFCLPNIARILKVREFILLNSSSDFAEPKSPVINSKNFSIAKKFFVSYPELEFETQFVSDFNLKFSNEFATNSQKVVIANIVLSKYGRAKTKFFARNTAMTLNVEQASQVFYLKVLSHLKNSRRVLREPKSIVTPEKK